MPRICHRQREYAVVAFVVSVLYGSALAALPLDVFGDRMNYWNYADNSWEILQRYWGSGPLVGFFNEPVWLGINAVLRSIFPPDIVLRVIIFVPAVLVAWYVLVYEPRHFFILLFFLLLPQVVGYHLTGLRQGVAVAVFMAGWFASERWLKWVLIGVFPLIHASFFFILLLLGLVHLAKYLRLSLSFCTLFIVVSAIGVAVVLGPVAELLGARQAGVYAFTLPKVSGLGFLFWLGVFLLMCLQGQAYMRRYVFESNAIVFYLSTYFLIEVTARIFESALIFVLLAGLKLTDWRRSVFILMIFMYGVLQYFERIEEPWLGFGAA